MTAQHHPAQLSLDFKALNTKAMLARLSISKPTTSRRDTAAEQFTQQSLADAGLRVSATLFKERTSPVRVLLNSASAVYHYHKQNTLPYIDRGPRLLPVAHYEKYRDEMRKLIGEVDKTLRNVMPDYAQHVANDMATRGGRAAVGDYPTAQEFEDGFKLDFTFSPLPDNAHWLFDVSEEDKAALNRQMQDVADGVRADLKEQLAEPVRHLIDKLRIPAGEKGSIFRDSAVENVVDAIGRVRILCMGDEGLLAMCDEVQSSLSGHARNPQVLRDSPIVREQAVARLKEVADRMGFMMGA